MIIGVKVIQSIVSIVSSTVVNSLPLFALLTLQRSSSQ